MATSKYDPPTRAKYAYPFWRYPSFAAYQAQKRRDLKAARKALDKLLGSAAWLPGRGSTAVLRMITDLRGLDAATKRSVWKGELRK